MGYFVDESNRNAGGGNYREGPVVRLYLKRSEGTTFVDETFSERIVAAHDAGAVCGAYHFGGHDDPVAEASFFLSLSGTRPRPGQLRPCLDDEAGASDAWVEAFLLHCRKVLGYWPTYYASTSVGAPRRQRSAIIRKCPWWRAEYGANDGRCHPLSAGGLGAAAHQYTSVGQVPGLSGPRDLSVLLSPTLFVPVPPSKPLRRGVHAAWDWAQWYLGVGRYKGRARKRRYRPHVPLRVPQSWWRYVRWYQRNTVAK